MTAPGFWFPIRRLICCTGGVKKKKPTAGSLQAVGWKLGLALRQFLPSPEAPVVFVVLIMVVEVVVETDDIGMTIVMALCELAEDSIT